jgi:Fibronectin type III domain
VDAYDAAGNRSGKTALTSSTSACAPGGDTTPPTAPSNLALTAATTSSLALSWSASTDNTAVSGYGRYQNNTLISNTTGSNHTYTGLACGSSYTLAIDAYDAAGNRSNKATLSASTSACPPPPSGSASVFISPSGSDSSGCTQAAPCRSFDRAYRVAAAGATVEVAAGSYPGQTINPDGSKTSANDIVFRPASGAAVTMTGELEANGAHFEVRDMTLHQVNFPRSADDITLRNVITHGLWMQGPSNISIIGGEITCGACGYHSHLQNGGSDNAAPRNILFDGVNFHDWHSISGEHVECLQILGADGVTIRNSIFKNCGTGSGGLGATADLHIAWTGVGAMTKNILLENNFFYASGNPYTIQMDDYANIDLRNNSIAGPILMFDRSGPGTGIDIVGNILRASNCTAEGVAINWRYNVIQGGTCGATDKNAAPGFLDTTNNLHLTAGSPAINAGDPTNYPSHDIDGQTRPTGTTPDAGADEAG